MATKSTELRRLMQDNAQLLRVEHQIRTTGGDVGRGFDAAFGAVGIAPRLIVPELASRFAGPQGEVLHLPIHISEREGGRRSLFALGPGQETVPGLYLVQGKLYERRVRKRNGTAAVQVGDTFIETITDMAGAKAQVHAYHVMAVGVTTGALYLESITAEGDLETGDLVNDGEGWCWFCNMGSQWWCGFPCLPGDFGDIFV
jgi:hypothetical protein